MNLSGVEIGAGQPCRVIAEVSNNHNGDFDRCIRLIDAIHAAGADIVKFQCYTPQELVDLRGDGPAPDPWGSEGWTMRDLYTKAQTPHEWFSEIVGHCQEIGLPWFSSVFGPESLKLLEMLRCPAYKIAALDVETEFTWAVSTDWDGTGVHRPPFIASSRVERVRWADFTLYCPEGYPQEHIDFDQLQHFDGLSYHGTDPAVLIQAAAGGAMLVECHVQLAAEPSELEAGVSLTEVQLAEVCAEIA